eukprot:gnl/MRDRNA2_/MRDRNA2_30938_c0_seq1.p1 gnl/MRDRNA2_/MRDRNA2_30938_c0~~gnl/MRDRNA2_/MRDRNA2_30938_c0_seq1.p1  ORF type:complete len:243 (+),score=24.55 gnl/MRDRNA2_/MRDRNA2_30938_c0_seq1:637-1365(+)
MSSRNLCTARPFRIPDYGNLKSGGYKGGVSEGPRSPSGSSTASTASTAAESPDLDRVFNEVTENIPYETERKPDISCIQRAILSQRRHAYYQGDLFLMMRFTELLALQDIEASSVKLLLRSLKFLHLCDYTTEEICSILAHASKYFKATYDSCGKVMENGEVGYVLVVLMFIAHSYTQDETCPLAVWHQHLFKRYCPLNVLIAAVFRLMELQQFILRLEAKDLEYRHSRLMKAVSSEVSSEK